MRCLNLPSDRTETDRLSSRRKPIGNICRAVNRIMAMTKSLRGSFKRRKFRLLKEIQESIGIKIVNNNAVIEEIIMYMKWITKTNKSLNQTIWTMPKDAINMTSNIIKLNLKKYKRDQIYIENKKIIHQ